MLRSLATANVIPLRKEFSQVEEKGVNNGYFPFSPFASIKNKLVHIAITMGLVNRVDRDYFVVSE